MFPDHILLCFLLTFFSVSYSHFLVFPTPIFQCFLLTFLGVSYSHFFVFPTHPILSFWSQLMVFPTHIFLWFSVTFWVFPTHIFMCFLLVSYSFPTRFLLVSYSFPTHLPKGFFLKKIINLQHIYHLFSNFFNYACTFMIFFVYLRSRFTFYDLSPWSMSIIQGSKSILTPAYISALEIVFFEN